jgi:hypothetical protein
MKKLIFVLLIFFLPLIIQSQTLTEKSLCSFDNLTGVDGYSFRLDEKTGTYLYLYYDSTKNNKNTIISNKGNSDYYDFIDYFTTVFDKDGNYYLVANRNLTDTTYKYFFLKNGVEILSCDNISQCVVEKNGIIYMICSEQGKSYLVNYEMKSGTIAKGKYYDNIFMCSFDKFQGEGEPAEKIGFTSDGKPYYMAKKESQAFIVVGDEEKKHFADIDPYNVILDKTDNFIYIAKDTGSFMYPGGTFVVNGDKKYQSFYYVYNLSVDEKGNVIYIGTDSSFDESPQKVMSGDEAISKTYRAGISNLGFTADGKIYFVANERKKQSDEYESFVVLNGKEGKHYQSIDNIKVLTNNELLYAVQQTSEHSAVVKANKEFPLKQPFVMNAEILKDGRLSYIGVIYGNYDKKIKDKYYLYIDDDEFGPYDGMQPLDYVNMDYLLSDKNGNYVFLANEIRNFTDYYSALFTSDWKSEYFDNIQDVSLYNGKPLYTVMKITDKVNYISKYRIYYGGKPISPEYDSISDYKFDEKTGLISFITTKGKEVLKVEIKF